MCAVRARGWVTRRGPAGIPGEGGQRDVRPFRHRRGRVLRRRRTLLLAGRILANGEGFAASPGGGRRRERRRRGGRDSVRRGMVAVLPQVRRSGRAQQGQRASGNLLRGRPIFPHPRISRDSFLHAVSLRGLERLRAGLDFRIVISHPPRWLGAVLGSAVAAAADELERRVTRRLRRRWVKVLGFRARVVRACDCTTPEELVHAIFQSSTAPPIFPVTRRDGAPAIDGGLVESVPLSAVADCRRPLVLLSRHQRELPSGGREVYACPSRPVPVSPWDFASPDKVIETFELGRRDGERFLGVLSRPVADDAAGRTR